MKRLAAIIALLIVASSAARFGSAAAGPSQGGERGHPVLQLGNNKIEVDHGRPILGGRKPETMIQPGQVWRMGSNTPTTLSTQASLKIGDKVIPAGKYNLQAKLVEAQKWQLLIAPEGGSVIAEVPFNLQTLDKSVELLTITLEKKDKGGRLILQWGTLSLAADFQPAAMTAAAMTAAADDSGKWSELSAFHDVMSATFHPMEEGDFNPIRNRASEMATIATKWAGSTPPKVYDRLEIKTNVAKLAQESKALAALVAKKASDAQIKESLSALHDRFHESPACAATRRSRISRPSIEATRACGPLGIYKFRLPGLANENSPVAIPLVDSYYARTFCRVASSEFSQRFRPFTATNPKLLKQARQPPTSKHLTEVSC